MNEKFTIPLGKFTISLGKIMKPKQKKKKKNE